MKEQNADLPLHGPDILSSDEFDRQYHSIVVEPLYSCRNLTLGEREERSAQTELLMQRNPIQARQLREALVAKVALARS